MAVRAGAGFSKFFQSFRRPQIDSVAPFGHEDFTARSGAGRLCGQAPDGRAPASGYPLYPLLQQQTPSFLGVWLGGRLFDAAGDYRAVWWAAIGLGLFAMLIHLPIDDGGSPRCPPPRPNRRLLKSGFFNYPGGL